MQWIQSLLAVLVVYLVKASFLATYFKLHQHSPDFGSSGHSNTLLVAIGIYMALCGVLPNVLFLLLSCGSVAANWDSAGGCVAVTNKPASAAFSVASISTDILVMMYGLGLARQLQCRRKAVAASIVAGLGSLSMAACAARWAGSWLSGFADQWFWYSLESCTVIVAACLPALHAWLRTKCPEMHSAVVHWCSHGRQAQVGRGSGGNGGAEAAAGATSGDLHLGNSLDNGGGEEGRGRGTGDGGGEGGGVCFANSDLERGNCELGQCHDR